MYRARHSASLSGSGSAKQVLISALEGTCYNALGSLGCVGISLQELRSSGWPQ